MRAMMTMMAARDALTATTQAFHEGALGSQFRDGDHEPLATSPVQTVLVVDVDILTPTAQSEIYATAARTDRAELAALHEAIERSPMAIEALAESGAGPDDIIGANIDGSGALILVANRGF
jgi:hypothetical protein